MHTFKAMNTHFLVEGFAQEYELSMEGRVRESEKRFSRFDPSSELCALNNGGSGDGTYSPDMVACICEAMEYYRSTAGVFNPFVGNNMESIGYDRSFELLQGKAIVKPGSGGNLLKAMLEPPVEVDKLQHKLLLKNNAKLDLGGFAKGWTAQRLSMEAKGSGYASGLIDAGGDLVAWGSHVSGHPWLIGVADPFYRNQDAFDLLLTDSVCVATSSVLERRWELSDGSYRNHIIDPRTGTSTSTDIVQVSVFSENLAKSEAFSKYIILEGVQGLTRNMKLIDENHLGYIVFTNTGSVITNDMLDTYILERRASYDLGNI